MLRWQVGRFVGMGSPTSSGFNFIKRKEHRKHLKNTSYETNNKKIWKNKKYLP